MSTKRPPFFRASVSVYSRADKTRKHSPTSIKLSSGADCAAHLAYISGHTLVSGYDGQTRKPEKDPTRIQQTILIGYEGKEIQPATPENLQKLTKNLDKMDKRKNSRFLREIKLSLPRGLSKKEHGEITMAVSKRLQKRYKTCIAAAYHIDKKELNPHAHINLPTRVLNKDGETFGAKIRVLDDRKTGPKEIEAIRAICAEETNRVLAKTKSKAVDKRPVSHLSYKRQGLDLVPKKSLPHTRKTKQSQKKKKHNDKIVDFNRARAEVRRLDKARAKELLKQDKARAAAKRKAMAAFGQVTGAQHYLQMAALAYKDPAKFAKTASWMIVKNLVGKVAKEGFKSLAKSTAKTAIKSGAKSAAKTVAASTAKAAVGKAAAAAIPGGAVATAATAVAAKAVKTVTSKAPNATAEDRAVLRDMLGIGDVFSDGKTPPKSASKSTPKEDFDFGIDGVFGGDSKSKKTAEEKAKGQAKKAQIQAREAKRKAANQREIERLMRQKASHEKEMQRYRQRKRRL